MERSRDTLAQDVERQAAVLSHITTNTNEAIEAMHALNRLRIPIQVRSGEMTLNAFSDMMQVMSDTGIGKLLKTVFKTHSDANVCKKV